MASVEKESLAAWAPRKIDRPEDGVFGVFQYFLAVAFNFGFETASLSPCCEAVLPRIEVTFMSSEMRWAARWLSHSHSWQKDCTWIAPWKWINMVILVFDVY